MREVHVVGPVPDRLPDVSPVVWDTASEDVYVGFGLGRGGHHRLYNRMQERGALAPRLGRGAHGYYRSDGGFEWDERFYVPSPAEARRIRSALERRLGRGAEESGGVEPGERLRVAARRPIRLARALGRSAAAWVARRKPPEHTPPFTHFRTSRGGGDGPYEQFLSGDAFAARCRYALNYDGFHVREDVDNDWWFCRTDWVEHFFREWAPTTAFVLFTHNSDRALDRRLGRYARRRNVVAWFACNLAAEHPKLHAIPLGVGHPDPVLGDAGVRLEAARSAGRRKDRLFDVGFDIRTNPAERLRCLAETGLELDDPVPSDAYLERLAATYFCVAPSGNGIDTHRLWEALYVGTVPVVTRTRLSDQHPELPLIVLDDWSQFRTIDFSPELYRQVWGDWDAAALSPDRYLEGIARIVAERRAEAGLSTSPSRPRPAPGSGSSPPR